MPYPPSFFEVLRDSREVCEEAQRTVEESRRVATLVSWHETWPDQFPLEGEAWEDFLEAFGDAVLLGALRDFSEE